MPKTPDEIKKGLECCIDGFSCRTTCPYTTPFFNIEKCTQALATDALAIIQQLEAQNAELLKKVEQLQAERDAAVAVIRQDGGCNSCLYSDRKVWEEPCLYCEGNERWQWRGVQKEE